jgi:hypothetical protein
MTIKEFFTDIKVWIGIIVVIAGIVVGMLTYSDIPERVEQVEEKAVVVEKSVEKMATSVDMFMMEQRTIQTEQNKREELMLELIRSK